VFRLTERRLELLIISVYLFWYGLCQSRISAPHLEIWRYNELNPNCLYADAKKGKCLLLFRILFVSNF
jgi:hypothetical protein